MQVLPPSLSVIIPCFNEAHNISVLIQRFADIIESKSYIHKYNNDIEIIFVDNGSTDQTNPLLKKLTSMHTFARYITVLKNEGYGNGITQGLLASKNDYIGWTHADLQTDPTDLLGVLDILNLQYNPSKIFVKGRRKRRKPLDAIFTLGMSIFESLLFRRRLFDINAQPTIFPRSLLKLAKTAPKDFSFDLYYYLIALLNNYKIIRFNVFFNQRLHGVSSWNKNFMSQIHMVMRTIRYSILLKNSLANNFYLQSNSNK